MFIRSQVPLLYSWVPAAHREQSCGLFLYLEVFLCQISVLHKLTCFLLFVFFFSPSHSLSLFSLIVLPMKSVGFIHILRGGAPDTAMVKQNKSVTAQAQNDVKEIEHDLNSICTFLFLKQF